MVLGETGFTHEYVSVFEVVPPVRPYLPLASDVPDVQLKALRLDTLNVESLETTQGSVPNVFSNTRRGPNMTPPSQTRQRHNFGGPVPVWGLCG